MFLEDLVLKIPLPRVRLRPFVMAFHLEVLLLPPLIMVLLLEVLPLALLEAPPVLVLGPWNLSSHPPTLDPLQALHLKPLAYQVGDVRKTPIVAASYLAKKDFCTYAPFLSFLVEIQPRTGECYKFAIAAQRRKIERFTASFFL
ncbi:MAG: hypothetical protein J3Q66DRAFT_184600 [Benniella sp.]|nr:MAG: hypothetical protein J3Q66DRAFT_184600 [Benniella sp.]